MLILSAFFTDSGVPATALSPVIRVYRLSDNALVVNDDPMVEIADGLYDYDFTSSFDDTEEYVIRADGTASLTGGDRYKSGGLDGDSQVTRMNIGNRADIVVNVDTSRTITVYDVDDTTVLAVYDIDITGLLRVRTS